MNNGLIVFNAFCKVGVFGGPLLSLEKAFQVAACLRQEYKSFNLNIKAREVFGKTWQEVHVYIDNLLWERHQAIQKIFYLPPERLN